MITLSFFFHQIWQDSLRDFLGCTIQAIGKDSFTCSLITAQVRLFVLFLSESFFALWK